MQYLWTYLVLRLGLRWWGIAAVAGILVSVGLLVWDRTRRRSVGAGRLVPAGLLATYVIVVVAATVIVRPRQPNQVSPLDVVGRLWRIFGRACARPRTLGEHAPAASHRRPAAVRHRLGMGRTLLFSLCLSTGIETTQYLWSRGQCELADIALNVFGALVGYGLWRLVQVFRERKSHRPRHMR